MTEQTPNEQTSVANSLEKKPKKRGLFKWLFWIAAFLGLTWFLQQQGPITVNGISLTVPVSEEPKEQ